MHQHFLVPVGDNSGQYALVFFILNFGDGLFRVYWQYDYRFIFAYLRLLKCEIKFIQPLLNPRFFKLQSANVRVFPLVEYHIFRLGNLLRPEVLVNHLLVEPKRHPNQKLTQLTHVVDCVFIEVPAVEHFLPLLADLPDVLVLLRHYSRRVLLIAHEEFLVVQGCVWVCVLGLGLAEVGAVERVDQFVPGVAYFAGGA